MQVMSRALLSLHRATSSSGAVLVVGHQEDDSTAELWRALQQQDEQKHRLSEAAPLLYGFMHLDTVDSEEGKRIGLWLLKGPTARAAELLDVPLGREALAESSVIININIAHPASISRCVSHAPYPFPARL